MTAQVRWGALRVAPDLARRLEEYQRSAKGRAVLARVANGESRKIVVIAEEVAREDLHQRSDPSRRSPLSKSHGKRLHESFEAVPAKEVGYKMRAGIRNTHPAFKFVDGGTRPHVISATGTPPQLVFPWDGTRGVSGGKAGVKGTFAVDWEDAPAFVGPTVNHPGAAPRNILQRAVRRYRRRSQGYRVS